MVIKDGKLYEQIWNEEDESMFLTMNDGHPKTVEKVDEIHPIGDSAIKKGVVVLPDKTEEYGSIQKLVKEIQEHLNKYLDISEDHEIFASFYVLFSWVYDKTTTLNYLRSLGDWGTGKSRYLDVIGRMCYKPIMVNGALTPAVVYRLLDLWGGTLILDEGDFKKSDEQADIIKILNAGFEKSRSSVARCNPNDPSIIDTFKVYGPKVLASRKTWYDQALESRCMTERMKVTNRKDIPPILDKEYYEKETELRRKLLKFRFDYYDKISYEYKDLGIPDLEPRLKQAVSSFAVLFHNIPGLMRRFRKFIRKYNEALIEERSSSYEGMIAWGVISLIMKGEKNFGTRDVCEAMSEEFGGDFKSRSVGKILKSLGFDIKVKRTKDGTRRCIIFEPDILKSVAERYLPVGHEFRKNIKKNVTSVTFVTTPLGGPTKNVTSPSVSGFHGMPRNGRNKRNKCNICNTIEEFKEKFPDDGCHGDFIRNQIGADDKMIQKAKDRSLIHETRPDYYEKVKG